MTSSGTVKLKKIWKMLDKCARGYTRQAGKHYWTVRYLAYTFPTLPLGSHGAKNPEIQVGIVKQMIRQFQIEPCAQRELEILR